MKRSILFLFFQVVIITFSTAQINQKGRSIPYFNSYTSPKSWDSFKSDVYQGGAAQFVNINGDVPVDMTQGSGSLVLESKICPSLYMVILYNNQAFN